MSRGWDRVVLKMPTNFEQGCQYGTIPLQNIKTRNGEDKTEILIFGGICKNKPKVTGQTGILTVDNANF